MTANLRFDTPITSAQPVDLRFGSPVSIVGDSYLYSVGTIPAPTLSAALARVKVLTFAATIPAPAMSASLLHNNSVSRGVSGGAAITWQAAYQQLAVAKSRFQVPMPQPVAKTQRWQVSAKLRSTAPAMWRGTTGARRPVDPHWQGATKVGSDSSHAHTDLVPKAVRSDAKWTDADHISGSSQYGWQDRFRYPRPTLVTHWQGTKANGIDHHGLSGAARSLQAGDTTPWQNARKPPPGVYRPSGITVPDVCYHPPGGDNVPLLFKDVFTTDADLLFYCARNVIPPAATVVVSIKRTYIVINDAQLLRVDGNHQLPTYSLSLNIDMDSWTWGFNASLPASALSLVEPSGAGDPVLLKAMINGTSYLLLAESIQRDRSFGSSRISVSGRGRSAMLADPYSPILTFANNQARTAQQLMADALTINGVSLGWDIDWRITDWLVPAGAWNHQGSYMSAVNAIAAAAGAFIQPDPVNQILRVRPRYPVAPWDWYGSSITPDLELPADVITKEGIAWAERPAYNAVYVSGTTAGGILGHVKRTGSAGGNAAPMITDALITHADAARQRGLNVLADTGRSATYTLSLPVLPETGIIDPGTLVRYVDNGNPTVGVVKGVSVTVGLPKVQQTIEVQTHG